MEDRYVIKSAFALGDEDPKYGQTWYCKVEELEMPVMFNLMSGSVQEMDRISFETQEIKKFKSGKNEGEEYRRLRKVKVEEHAPRVATAPKNNDIEERLTKLEVAVFGDTGTTEDKLDNEEPVNMDDIPF